jgi:hypothetical protein
MSDRTIEKPDLSDRITPELDAAVREKAHDGRISCPVLRKLAEDMGMPYKVAGAAADAAGIKVGSCDLGCF